jgi:hypothetical protein
LGAIELGRIVHTADRYEVAQSGPLEALNRAAAAKYLQIELDDGRILDARVLQVHLTGLALVTLKARQA